jgi:hypothetical protein
MKSYILLSFQILLIILFFAACHSPSTKNRLTPEEQAKYINEGKSIVIASFKAFTREITNAINEGGVQHAVKYCHLKASPLIDSLSGAHQVKISRISDKFRNPADKPDQLDQEVLNTYKKQLEAGAKLQPHLEVTDDEVIYYSPILILDPLCLNCHGMRGTNITDENFEFIRSKYPEDLAFGYKLGDLRGTWKIILWSN